jgi:hypothetical protein
MPSISVRTWLPSVPRTRTWVKLPTAPVRLTAMPGTSRRTSDTIRIWRSWKSCAVTMVTDEPILSAWTPSMSRVPVTIRSSSVVGAASAA